MKIKKQLLLLLGIICFSFASFTLVSATAAEDICTYVTVEKEITTGYTIPAGIPYSTETFLAVTQENETIGHVIIEDGTVTSIGCTSVENPTNILTVKDKQTVVDIFESEKPVSTLNEKMSEKSISIDGQGFSKDVTNFFTSIGLKIASWFD